MTKPRSKYVNTKLSIPKARPRTRNQLAAQLNTGISKSDAERRTKKRHDPLAKIASYTRGGIKVVVPNSPADLDVRECEGSDNPLPLAPPVLLLPMHAFPTESGTGDQVPLGPTSGGTSTACTLTGGQALIGSTSGGTSTTGGRRWQNVVRTRSISSCRFVSAMLFKDRNISWAYAIQKDTVWPFFNLNEPVYPEFVRQFYADCLVGDGDTSIDTVVGTKRIHLDVATLAKVLHIPAKGVNVLCMSKNDQLKAYKAAVKCAHIKGRGMVSLNNAAELSAENRLLHQIISYMILPRSGSYSTVHRADLILLVHILQGKDINLPEMIFSEMIRTVKKNLAFLPYGSILTKVFKYFNVDIPATAECCGLTPYDGKLLPLMGIGTDKSTHKLVRLKKTGPRRRRSVSHVREDVLDAVKGLEKKVDNLVMLCERKEKSDKKLKKKLDKMAFWLNYALGISDDEEQSDGTEEEADVEEEAEEEDNEEEEREEEADVDEEGEDSDEEEGVDEAVGQEGEDNEEDGSSDGTHHD